MLIRESFRRCLLAVLLQLGAACAQGYATEPPQAIEVPVVDAGHAVFTGESCTIGDRQSCVCPMGGTGLRACVPNSTSPTGGELSGCLPCDTTPSYTAGHGAAGTPATGQSSNAVTEPAAAGKPASSSGGSGGSGRAGSSATASNAGGKGGSGGSSASGSAGKSSTSATAGSGGKPAAGGGGTAGRSSGGTTSGGSTSSGSKACSSDCASQLCFPLGVLGCCKSNGSCGCTWAPGAYCM